MFQQAIDAAYRAILFRDDFCFKDFPTGCCGDTSCLLAEYLLQKGIETIWGSTQRDEWTHAWIVLKYGRVRKNIIKSLPDNYLDLISAYRNQDLDDETKNTL